LTALELALVARGLDEPGEVDHGRPHPAKTGRGRPRRTSGDDPPGARGLPLGPPPHDPTISVTEIVGGERMHDAGSDVPAGSGDDDLHGAHVCPARDRFMRQEAGVLAPEIHRRLSEAEREDHGHGPQQLSGILADANAQKREEIIALLKKSYWMEIETVMSYIANSINPDGVRAQEIIESLQADIAEELDHAAAVRAAHQGALRRRARLARLPPRAVLPAAARAPDRHRPRHPA
jgi:hypothetical protein